MKHLCKLSDDELVKLFVGGNSECVDVLIERHKNRIFSYIFMCVKKYDIAEDIFQDTFLKVVQSLKAGRYKETGKFTSWVMRISHNLIIDHFRRQKNMGCISKDDCDYDLFNHVKFAESSIESKMVYDQLLSDIGKLVKHLPANQREIIEMRHYQGLSFKEIAEETNVSINTALGRMRYAIINLRKMADDNNLIVNL
jgi:RNA polymerase sigma-70 factor (ECF subfamily)